MATVTNATFSSQRAELTQTTGVSPFIISSTTVNTNLNADLLDGQHGAYYLDLANATGTLDDAAVSETAVTQHEAALSIAASQVDSGNLAYARLPTGSGSWDVGGGNTLTLTQALTVASTLTVQGTGSHTFSGPIQISGTDPRFTGNRTDANGGSWLIARRSGAVRINLRHDSNDDLIVQTVTGSAGSESYTNSFLFQNATGYTRAYSRLGVATDPSYPLHVSGDSYLNGAVGVGAVPSANKLYVYASASRALQASTANAGSNVALFDQLAASATVPVLVVRGGATPGSGADLQQWQNSTPAAVASVDNAGNITAVSFRSDSFMEITDGTPANPAASKARIFWDETAGSVKAVDSAGTVISLGSVGGALTDAYASLAGDSGTASASGGAQLSIVGAGGITTAAADGSPDTLTITLGNHSADLLTSGTVATARLGTVPETKGGTNQTTYAAGDILYASAVDTLAKLPKGDDDDILTLASGLPSWAPPAASGAMTQIAESVLSVDAATFVFTSIPATYRHLLLVVSCRTDTSAGAEAIRFRFNGDATAIYDSQRLQAIASSVAAAESIAATSGVIGDVPALNASAGAYSNVEILVADYAGASNHKVAYGKSASKSASSTGGVRLMNDIVHWRDTDTVTAITLFPAGGGDFVAGSVATLYGLS